MKKALYYTSIGVGAAAIAAVIGIACFCACRRRRRHRHRRTDVEHGHRVIRRSALSPDDIKRILELTGKGVPVVSPTPPSSVDTNSSTPTPDDAEAAIAAAVRADEQRLQEEPVVHLDYAGREVLPDDEAEAEPVRVEPRQVEVGEPSRSASPAACTSSDSSSSSGIGIVMVPDSSGRPVEWHYGPEMVIYDVETPEREALDGDGEQSL